MCTANCSRLLIQNGDTAKAHAHVPNIYLFMLFIFLFLCAVPVDGGTAGLLPTQLRVPVLGRVLVVVAELGLSQECAQLLRLLRAHSQVTVVEILLHVHEEDVSRQEENILWCYERKNV